MRWAPTGPLTAISTTWNSPVPSCPTWYSSRASSASSTWSGRTTLTGIARRSITCVTKRLTRGTQRSGSKKSATSSDAPAEFHRTQYITHYTSGDVMVNSWGHTGLTWRTALSCNGGACVQVAATENGVLLGNTRQPSGPVLSYTPDEWREFVAGIKKGDFDDLLK